jgi:hypothetical protein
LKRFAAQTSLRWVVRKGGGALRQVRQACLGLVGVLALAACGKSLGRGSANHQPDAAAGDGGRGGAGSGGEFGGAGAKASGGAGGVQAGAAGTSGATSGHSGDAGTAGTAGMGGIGGENAAGGAAGEDPGGGAMGGEAGAGPTPLPPPIFAPPEPVTGVSTSVHALASGDLNGDGKPDLVVGHAGSARISVLLNDGGAFGAPSHYNATATGFDVVGLAVADFDGDGDADVAAGTLSMNDSLQLFDNDGEGDLSAGASSFTPCTGNPLRRGIVAADLDRDGALDIATPCGYYMLRDGDAWDQVVIPSTDSLVGGDVNGDGWVDLVSPGGAVLANQRDGSFVATRTAGSERFSGIALADLDGDGDQDIVTGNTTRKAIEILWNSDGVFEPPVHVAIDGSPWAVAAGDLNGDALPDLVASVFSAPGFPYAVVRVLTNEGDRFSEYQTLDSDAYNAELVLTDVDGDGTLDIVSGNQGGGAGGPISLWLGTAP